MAWEPKPGDVVAVKQDLKFYDAADGEWKTEHLSVSPSVLAPWVGAERIAALEAVAEAAGGIGLISGAMVGYEELLIAFAKLEEARE